MEGLEARLGILGPGRSELHLLTRGEEWEPRPTSPSSIRLIHMGRLLDDKISLKGLSHVCPS